MGLFGWVMKGFGIEKKKEEQSRRPVSNVIDGQNEVVQEAPEENKFDLRNFSSPTLFGEGQHSSADFFSGNGAVSMGGGKNIIITSPHSYSDIQRLIASLQRGEPCIINLQNLDSQDAQRKLDFLSGAIYSIGGSIKTLQPNTYILTPNGMGISSHMAGGLATAAHVSHTAAQSQAGSPFASQPSFATTSSSSDIFGNGNGSSSRF